MTWTKPDAATTRFEFAGLTVLYLIAAVSVAGFGVFRTWPSLLATVPDAAAVYPKAIAILPPLQIIAAMAVLGFFLGARAGHRWLGAFLVVCAISLSSELAGTTVGIPFGAYSYTNALGPKILGHVPWLIPVSWFMMALPSFALAADPQRGPVSRIRRVVVASLILLAWDLSLDPAMSAATAFWVWGEQGAYYGMPWLNLFGWFVTGLALMAALAALRADRWVDVLPRRWLAGYYGANLALSVGLAAVAGMWMAVIVSVIGLAVCAGLARPPRSMRAVVA
jgi:carotene biosynthesis associated membrane protein